MKRYNWNDPRLWRRIANEFCAYYRTGRETRLTENGMCFAVSLLVKDGHGLNYRGPAFDLLNRYKPKNLLPNGNWGWVPYGRENALFRSNICEQIAHDLTLNRTPPE